MQALPGLSASGHPAKSNQRNIHSHTGRRQDLLVSPEMPVCQVEWRGWGKGAAAVCVCVTGTGCAWTSWECAFVYMYLYMLACVHVQVSAHMCRHMIVSTCIHAGRLWHTSVQISESPSEETPVRGQVGRSWESQVWLLNEESPSWVFYSTLGT